MGKVQRQLSHVIESRDAISGENNRTPAHSPAAAVASTVVVLYLAPSRIAQYLSVYLAPLSDKVILTLKSINLKANDTKEALRLKLQGQNYIRRNVSNQST